MVWAAYYADRLSFLYRKWGSKATDPPFSNFDIHGELMRLPHRGIEMGAELLESAGISHSLYTPYEVLIGSNSDLLQQKERDPASL